MCVNTRERSKFTSPSYYSTLGRVVFVNAPEKDNLEHMNELLFGKEKLLREEGTKKPHQLRTVTVAGG